MSENNKYKLTDETKEVFGVKLFRIEAKMSFGLVVKGDKGGFIEDAENLCVSGNAWVSGNACVYGNAWVSGNARVYGNARVSGSACVYGNARVSGSACVSGNAWVYGDACVYGNENITKTVINMIAACSFSITAYGKYIQVGCMLKTVTEWQKAHKSGKLKIEFDSDKEYKQAVKAVRLAISALELQNSY
jgi:hypothetical protein